MKKKIIGIILTLTMVLTLLPAFALPTKAEGTIEIYKYDKNNKKIVAEENTDFEWRVYGEEEYLVINTSGWTLSKQLNTYIVLAPYVEEITLYDLEVNVDEVETTFVIDANASQIKITLMGNNKLHNVSEEGVFSNLVRCGVGGQNLIFTGQGNLEIHSETGAITSSPNPRLGEETSDITFDKDFSGKITAVQYGKPKMDDVDKLLKMDDFEEESQKESLKIVKFEDPTINSSGDINIYGGEFEIVNYDEGESIGRLVSGFVSCPCAVGAGGNLNITTSKPVTVKSFYGIAAAAYGTINIGKDVEQIVLFGPGNTEGSVVGALASGKEIVIDENISVFADEVKNADFNVKDIKKNATLKEIVINDDEENSEQTQQKLERTNLEGTLSENRIVGGKHTIQTLQYTYYVGNKVANAIVIKGKTNPETEDTSAMLIWAFAGLAALAVAAGILVSRKQRD